MIHGNSGRTHQSKLDRIADADCGVLTDYWSAEDRSLWTISQKIG
jgi:hypothetical protein